MTVWQKIVRVDKIHAALIWLKEHNPLYANITVPANPIDVLPTDDVTVSQDTNVNDVKAETQNTDDLVSENGYPHDKMGITTLKWNLRVVIAKDPFQSSVLMVLQSKIHPNKRDDGLSQAVVHWAIIVNSHQSWKWQ